MSTNGLRTPHMSEIFTVDPVEFLCIYKNGDSSAKNDPIDFKLKPIERKLRIST